MTKVIFKMRDGIREDGKFTPYEVGTETGESGGAVAPPSFSSDSAGADILAMFGDEPSQAFEEFEYSLNGTPTIFRVRRLSPKEQNAVNARISRLLKGGRISIQSEEEEEMNASALAISSCVVKEDGTPLFTIDNLMGKSEVRDRKGVVIEPAVKGLFDQTNVKAQEFVGFLSSIAYTINPGCNYFLKKKAEQMLEADLRSGMM